MRVYKVTKGNKSLIVAAHNPHQASQVSNLKDAVVTEVNITEPVVIWQTTIQTLKLDSTSEK